jgi:hypothetical protein
VLPNNLFQFKSRSSISKLPSPGFAFAGKKTIPTTPFVACVPIHRTGSAVSVPSNETSAAMSAVEDVEAAAEDAAPVNSTLLPEKRHSAQVRYPIQHVKRL